MVLNLWGPSDTGTPRLCAGTVTRPRRIRTESGVFGAFSLEVIGLGYFPECRLLQYRRGGFFAIGEWMLDARERTYPQFLEFVEPFKTWLARAARLEIIDGLYSEYGELLPEDEVLALDDEERSDRAEAAPLTIEELVRIEVPRQKGRLVSRRAQFDVVIGNGIRVKECRLVGRPGSASLVLPTSEGLRLRPIQLERALAAEIVRRAETFGIPPQPQAA